MDRGPLGARAVSVRPRLLCFPSSDSFFAEIVAEVASALPLDSSDELEQALRPLYPKVSVHVRALTGEPEITWYVYRERTFPAHPGEVEDRLQTRSWDDERGQP